jgi:hypothetical protein
MQKVGLAKIVAQGLIVTIPRVFGMKGGEKSILKGAMKWVFIV